MMAVTAASAKEVSKVNSDKVVNLAPPGTGYIVTPCKEDSYSIETIMLTTYSIVQGQTRVHTSNIGSGINWLAYDLNWGNSANSLSLTIYTPSGVNLGTYYDNADGSVNGRILLGVYPSQGYVEQGIWRSSVYGASVSGSQSYTINVYGH